MFSDNDATLRRLNTATAGVDPPFAALDLSAFEANRRDVARRAGGCTVRVATKSIRTRWAINDILRHAQFSGVMAFTLREAIWLASGSADQDPIQDVLVGYPTVDSHAIHELISVKQLRERVTLMIDDVAHLAIINRLAVGSGGRVRVCIDVDASWRPRALGRTRSLHVGTRRSPLHDLEQVVQLAVKVMDPTGHTDLVGLMFYEAQIAGVGNQPPGHILRGRAITAMQKASAREISTRRPTIVHAVNELLTSRSVAPLEFVNAGGTGSLELSSTDPTVSEVTAGSGFFAPTLFDAYRHFSLIPAATFALPVVRRPGPTTVTVAGGGYVASGPTQSDRSPTPWLPTGLRLDHQEGAGEVQTPLHGDIAAELAIGDRVWFRHAKAGELAERFNEFILIRGSEIVAKVPTYRGEGQAFL